MTVLFFIIPVAILDFASFSFHVPMFGFSARLAATPTTHNASAKTMDLVFILPSSETQWMELFLSLASLVLFVWFEQSVSRSGGGQPKRTPDRRGCPAQDLPVRLRSGRLWA